MPSLISWLDYSEAEQRRTRETLQFFMDKGTVDDLGIGTIRDAFSNALFPGTSIIQTRARYFLFVPWIYREAERRFPDRVAAKGADLERRLIEALRQGGDLDGLIGRDAGMNVKALPSRIYWQGLAVHGIFKAPGLAIGEYARRAARGRAPVETEGELAGRNPSFWDAEIPDPPADFFKFEPITFALAREEAEWLCERVLASDAQGQSASLLSVLVRDLRRRETMRHEENVWDIDLPAGTPDRMRRLVHHAERFSCAANGAAWLYNLMLARMRARNEVAAPSRASVDFCEESFQKWCAWASQLDLRGWARDISAFQTTVASTAAPIPASTRTFVSGWMRILARGAYAAIPTAEDACGLILQREIEHKKAQARLRNDKRLRAWRGEAGTVPLSYRWPLVRRILNDVAAGLGASRRRRNH